MSTTQKKLILVIGATGAQGRSVVDALLAPTSTGATTPYAVRALTRDLESAQARELKSLGVDCVVGSFKDVESVAKAMEGVYGVYVNTDGFTVGELQEVYSGIRIFETAKQTPTLRHYVYSGLIYAFKMQGYNPDYKVDHLDAKGRVVDFLRSQASVPTDNELSWSVINTGPYMELLLAGLFDPITVRADGTVVFAAPVGDGRVPMIALKDLGWWARWIFDHREETSGKEVHVTSELVSWEHLVETFTKVTGKPSVYVRQTLDEYWNNFEPASINVPIAGDGSGKTTAKENFSGFWRVLRDEVWVPSKDIAWLKSVHPETYTLEKWMRENGYKGRTMPVLKNALDSRKGWMVREEVTKRL
ncbi:NmrA domain-containing protein [Mycena chlorophos]|uniref:NmrA domain-containing protein n=1 Tax=Mycena chlorophos TaxID=658473 RepID=A0A8H6SJJ6_MYCCL|nr:NmrA domain-containing protein [Mycena chlorophos]